MNFHQPNASVFVPDGQPLEAACARVTHLGIGAHPDDLEIMAWHGILACYRAPDQGFGGIVCTDGGGSPRAGPYAHHTADQIAALRRREQEEAARLGRYAVLFQLGHASASVRDAPAPVESDLAAILFKTKARVLYTHNPADKHDTHVAVAVSVIRTLRSLAPEHQPDAVYGCEVWRDLDWLIEDDKIKLNAGGQETLAQDLIRVFQSQIAVGKHYDLAVPGRRRAHATFLDPHKTDEAEKLIFAMDLTPLVHDSRMDIAQFIEDKLDRFRNDVTDRLKRFL